MHHQVLLELTLRGVWSAIRGDAMTGRTQGKELGHGTLWRTSTGIVGQRYRIHSPFADVGSGSLLILIDHVSRAAGERVTTWYQFWDSTQMTDVWFLEPNVRNPSIMMQLT